MFIHVGIVFMTIMLIHVHSKYFISFLSTKCHHKRNTLGVVMYKPAVTFKNQTSENMAEHN